MSGMRIPEAAYVAAATAYDLTDLDSGWSEAVDAAAPLIAAVELRRLANLYERRAASVVPLRRDSILDCADAALSRADELDPEGLTRD